MPEIYDHNHKPVRHMRARVNGIRMHYVIAGEGEPLLLLHGTPKTHFYWYKLIPLIARVWRYGSSNSSGGLRFPDQCA